MTENQVAAIEADLKALRALTQHRGWAIIEETLKTDIVAAAMSMADNPVMSEKERDFRCGALAAARNLLNVVPALIQRMENDLLMAAATAAANHPTATAQRNPDATR